MATSRLTTTRWTPPGVYLGRKSVPRPAPPLGARKICLIGRGSRLKNILNTEITRSRVYNESVIFAALGAGDALYQATLQHRANLDKASAFLMKRNGEVVGPANWQFVEAEDINGNGLGYATTIQLKASAFDRDDSYTLTYQSIDRDILDVIPWHPPLDMRGFQFSGDQPNSHQYEEFQDFVITMNATNPYDLTSASSGAGSLLPNLKALTPPTTDPGLTLGEFTLDVENHSAGQYRFVITAVTPSGPGDGSVTYTVYFKPEGSTVFNLLGPYTAVIPNAAAGGDPIEIVIDDQLTTEITKAHTEALNPSESFYLTAEAYCKFVYHPDFFDAAGRPLYTAKDTRTVTFEVASVIEKNGTVRSGLNTAAVPGIINFTFTSSTQEGGFGTFSVVRPGTSGGGVGTAITAATPATLATTNVPNYNVQPTDTVIVVVDKGQQQIVTLTGVTPGAATLVELTSPTINGQLTGAEFFINGGVLGLRTLTGGADHYVQVISAPVALDFPVGEVSGVDATVTDASGDFGVEFIGRSIIITNATSTANRGTFTITGRTSATIISIRNDAAVTENLPVSGTWQVTSPQPNFNRAPFRDGIVFEIENPENVVGPGSGTFSGEKMTLTITNEHTIDWSLVRQRTEVFNPSTVYTDRVGLVTGTPATRYLILAEVPEVSTVQPLVIRNQSNAILYTITSATDAKLKQDSFGELMPTVQVPGYNDVVDGDLTVSYYSRGAEPSPGQVYYFSASVLRPLTDYNTVVELNSGDDASNFLAPSQIDNHLFIGSKIAYGQAPAPTTITVVQVFDSDQDGIYTNADFKNAIQASEGDKTITDRIVLQNFGSLLDLKTTTIAVNDPFVKGWALQWQGMPVNAPIGSDRTPNSIVYTAKKTLQVQGDNCARGAFIEVPNRWCKYTIQLDDGSQQQLVLDGSFLSVAGAAKTAGFDLPRQSLLRQSVDGFDDIEVFSDTDLVTVGSASTAYIQAQGSGFIWGESVTVDTSEPALNEISGRTQEQFVSRFVCQTVDATMVGVVADSPGELAILTQAAVADTLMSLHSQKIIADWTDDSGNPRPFDTTGDVEAVTDENDPRQVYFNFWYQLFFPGKRYNGLYSVGKNAFKSQTNS